jgi:hypothetical protein
LSSLTRIDRRRVTAATVLTLIALPSLWLMSRSDQSTAPNVATAGVVVTHEGGSDAGATTLTDAPGRSDALGSAGGAFLERPEYPLAESDTETQTGDGVIRIAVPHTSERNTLSGRATFLSTMGSPEICAIAGAPYGAQVTVTNLDNGFSVSCLALASPVANEHTVVLHTTVFASIADLTDSPVPVEFTW